MIEKKEFERRVKRKDNTFHIRLKREEWAILYRLSDRWQIGNFSGVLHRLIAVSQHLLDKYDELIKEKEALAKKVQL